MAARKILHITYDMNIGGTEQVIRNLIDGLDSGQFQSSVLCVDGMIGPWGQQLQQRGVPVYCLERKPGFDLRLIHTIRKLIRTENFDLIHSHQYTPYVYGLLGALGTGRPVIFTEHGRFYPDVSSFKRRVINPLLERGTAGLTAISAATAKALVTYENFSAERISVIYNGISDRYMSPTPELRRELGYATDGIIIGTISRLDVIKNQAMLIRSFARVYPEHPRLRLLIVGDGPLRTQLAELATSLKLEDAITFTGFRTNPQDYLALMDIFTLPSLSEGTSMTLLEAMSFGKPCIATAVGGTPEIIQQHHTGLLIDNEDEAALANAIQTLAGSPILRQQIGERARQEYERRFTLPSMVREYENLYTRVLS